MAVEHRKRRLAISAAFVGFLLTVAAAQGQDDELLEPEKAFAVTVEPAAPDRLRVEWRIADGYYMYRDKFRFAVADGAVSLGAAEFPAALRKQDEFFGEVEIYKNAVAVDLPVDRQSPRAQTLVLDLQGQGCNEPIGVCYPPITHRVKVQLAALAATDTAKPEAQAAPITSLRDLKGLLGGAGQQEFLHPDEAFRVELQAHDGTTLSAQFVIAEGYYLYRDKVKFVSLADDVRIGDYVLPPGKDKEDEFFGKVVAYYQGFDVSVPLVRARPGRLRVPIEVTYQGCAEKGICYPPIVKTIDVSVPDVVAAAGAIDRDTGSPNSGPPSVAGTIGFWGYIIAAFWTGVLLTFTPCVLPMIPILSSVIVGQGDQITNARGGLLSSAYVLGTAVTYTAVGVLAGATGEQLQAYFQNIWAIGVISALLMVLALSMFGLFEIQVPTFIQSRLQTRTQGIKGGTLSMVFVLGLVSALIVGACVSPLLILALGVAIANGDPVLGGAIMFAMALGMGVLLIALGFGAGFLLPKAGAWMERVKQVFGVMLLGVAVYLLGTVPWIPVLYLWGALLIVTAVYLGATHALPEGASGWRHLAKGVGVLMLVWGVLALLGGMTGNRDILRPLVLSDIIAASERSAGDQVVHTLFTRVNSETELDAQLLQARAAGKPVLLDYYADWCVDCIRMEKATFQDPQVNRVLREGFILLQVDVTDPYDERTRAIKKRYGVFGPPAMLFFARDGVERPELRRYGFIGPEEFLSHISTLTASTNQLAAGRLGGE